METYRRLVEILPGPIYVHCDAGSRASAISVLAEGMGDTADARLLEAARQGIVPGRDIEAFVWRHFGIG